MRMVVCDSCGVRIDDGTSYIITVKKCEKSLYWEEIMRMELCKDCIDDVTKLLEGNNDC
jgi:hypothetical protein